MGGGGGRGALWMEYILRPLRLGMWGCENYPTVKLFIFICTARRKTEKHTTVCIQVKLLNSTSGFSGVPSTLVNIYLNCNKTDIVA